MISYDRSVCIIDCMLQVVGTFCMDLAMKKAKEVGIGWVTCTGQENSIIFAAWRLLVLFKVVHKINFIPKPPITMVLLGITP